tara:strand:+ start:231 stop:404 length:174 start_codon:yes stop_codon:yes gene_type:complete
MNSHIEHINAIIEHIHEETTRLYEAMADREFEESKKILQELSSFIQDVKEGFAKESL